MTDVFLHLWRGSNFHNQSPEYQFSIQAASNPLADQEFFAPHNGSMNRFRMRVTVNTGTGPVSINFLRNGSILRIIEPIGIGQIGLFLSSNQLPMSFVKNDLLVMQIINAGPNPGSLQMELNCDLKFTL